MSYEGNLADTTPQIKEDIYGCVWFTPKQLLTQLENTKEQIRYVIDFWLHHSTVTFLRYHFHLKEYGYVHMFEVRF
jgi:hypothetical protein